MACAGVGARSRGPAGALPPTAALPPAQQPGCTEQALGGRWGGCPHLCPWSPLPTPTQALGTSWGCDRLRRRGPSAVAWVAGAWEVGMGLHLAPGPTNAGAGPADRSARQGHMGLPSGGLASRLPEPRVTAETSSRTGMSPLPHTAQARPFPEHPCPQRPRVSPSTSLRAPCASQNHPLNP